MLYRVRLYGHEPMAVIQALGHDQAFQILAEKSGQARLISCLAKKYRNSVESKFGSRVMSKYLTIGSFKGILVNNYSSN
jgi:hypothetical protein